MCALTELPYKNGLVSIACQCIIFGNSTLRNISTQNTGQPGKDMFQNVPCGSVDENKPHSAHELRLCEIVLCHKMEYSTATNSLRTRRVRRVGGAGELRLFV